MIHVVIAWALKAVFFYKKIGLPLHYHGRSLYTSKIDTTAVDLGKGFGILNGICLSPIRGKPVLCTSTSTGWISSLNLSNLKWTVIGSFAPLMRPSSVKSIFELRDSCFNILFSTFELQESGFKIRVSIFEFQYSSFNIRFPRFVFKIRLARIDFQGTSYDIRVSRFPGFNIRF